jgi:hypothetical protein
MTQEATSPPAPEAAASPNIETEEQRNARLLEYAFAMKNLTPEEIGSITQRHPQRNIPQIILMIACNIGNLELVEWICTNHPDVVPLTSSPDTLAILQAIGITYPSSF